MLTHYEISQLLTNRRQPTFDRELVEGATAVDLDERLVRAYLDRVRRRSRAFETVEDDQLLGILGAMAHDGDGVARPTISGLLCLGSYPQQFFPQLFVSLVVLPQLRMGETSPDGRRFLDNQALTGPIPRIVADALAVAI